MAVAKCRVLQVAHKVLEIDAESSPLASCDSKQVCNLWQGYGNINRYTISFRDRQLTLIVKQVNPPKKSSMSTSHRRKLNSYQNEYNFYEFLRLKPDLSKHLRIPKPFHLECNSTDSFTFILSDLTPEYTKPLHTLPHVHAALEWLARFHSFFFLHPELPSSKRSSTSLPLHTIGTYWSLPNRLDELAQMPLSSPINKRLHRSAHVIHSLLYEGQRFKTVIHGDFKDENILFSYDGTACAAYDFQYTGVGLPAADLAYFLISSVPPEYLETEGHVELLKLYYSLLSDKVTEALLFDTLLVHFRVACVDYVRFMAGWGMWGNWEWGRNIAAGTLAEIDGGMAILEGEYAERASKQWGKHF
jgi:thiamine kinase-like enzyme